MKVDVIFGEIIKPSHPTPTHLKTHKLSFLDQFALRIYIPLLLYYTGGDKENIIDTNTRCNVIKKSLDKTLTKFYPLAGKIVNEEIERFVDCNDDGVDFCETKVSNCHELTQVIKEPDFLEQVKLFLPFDPSDHEKTASCASVLSVQVNVFEDCGGMVIGLCVNHKVADASSIAAFVNDWATIARGMVMNGSDRQIVKGPSFEVQSLFPQKENGTGFKIPSFPKDETVPVTKKFAFEASKLAELKERCKFFDDTEDVRDGYKPTTRVEALSSFLWKCFIDIDQAKTKAAAPARVYLATNAVNIRSRMVPQLPTSSFGNMVAITDAIFTINNNEKTGINDPYYPKLVQKFRDAVKRVDGEYIEALQSTDLLLNNMTKLLEHVLNGQTLSVSFTSWCRFPFYEADFGWGKPIWVSRCPISMKNIVVLVDSDSSGDGIEVYVTLDKEDMVEFEHHEELLALIS